MILLLHAMKLLRNDNLTHSLLFRENKNFREDGQSFRKVKRQR